MKKTYLPQAACLVYMRPDGKMAVATRRGKKKVGLPGGKVDPGETAAQAAARESGEEIGIEVNPEDLIELYADVCEPEAAGGQAYFCTTFLYFAPQDAVIKQMEAGIEVDWTDFDGLLANGTFVDYNGEVRAAYNAYMSRLSPSI